MVRRTGARGSDSDSNHAAISTVRQRVSQQGVVKANIDASMTAAKVDAVAEHDAQSEAWSQRSGAVGRCGGCVAAACATAVIGRGLVGESSMSVLPSFGLVSAGAGAVVPGATPAAVAVAASAAMSSGRQRVTTSRGIGGSPLALRQALLGELRASGANLPLEPSTCSGASVNIGCPSSPGIVATSALQRGATVGEVPAKAAFSLATLQRSALDLCQGLCTSEFAQLAFGLAVEKRSPSARFQRYIAALPTEAPLSYASDQLPRPHHHLLQLLDPETTATVDEVRKELVVAGQQLSPPLTTTEASWATAMVQSRALDVQGQLLMLPGLDLMNHDLASASVSHPRCADSVCWVTALKDVDVGAALTMSYGPWSNLALLTRYGFALQRNPFGAELGPHVFSRNGDVANKPQWLLPNAGGSGANTIAPDSGCSLAVLARGPRLFGIGAADVENRVGGRSGVRSADLRCMFFERAFEDEEDAEDGLSQGAGDCFPNATQSVNDCGNPRWRLVSAAVHASLAKECARRRGLFKGATKAIAEVEARIGADDNVLAQLSQQMLDALSQEFSAFDACSREHGAAAARWHSEDTLVG